MVDTIVFPVFLLEDSAGDCELLHLACQRGGLSIAWTMAGCCAEARTMLNALPADAMQLIIMDLCLPDGPSTTLLPLIANRFPGLPVLVFSTSSAPTDRSRINNHPSASYLVKPHTFKGYDEILGYIRHVLA